MHTSLQYAESTFFLFGGGGGGIDPTCTLLHVHVNDVAFAPRNSILIWVITNVIANDSKWSAMIHGSIS